MQALKGN